MSLIALKILFISLASRVHFSGMAYSCLINVWPNALIKPVMALCSWTSYVVPFGWGAFASTFGLELFLSNTKTKAKQKRILMALHTAQLLNQEWLCFS